LFVRLGNTIEYLKVFTPEMLKVTPREVAKELNLCLDSKTRVRRIMETESYTIINNDEMNKQKKFYCPDLA